MKERREEPMDEDPADDWRNCPPSTSGGQGKSRREKAAQFEKDQATQQMRELDTEVSSQLHVATRNE